MPIIGLPVGGINPTTFLTLVQRLAMECGIAKDPRTSIPTLVDAIGETARLATWIQMAWQDIQGLHQDWKFLRRSTSFTTIDGQATYTPVQAGIQLDTFGRWEVEEMGSFRTYDTAAGINGERFMTAIDHERWRNTYQIGAMRDAKSQPIFVTVTPDSSLGLGPVPLAGYTVTGDYYLAPVFLEQNTDEPALPLWHNKMIIVYKAMLDYGGFEAASEVYQRAERGYNKLLWKLESDQLKPVVWAC